MTPNSKPLPEAKSFLIHRDGYVSRNGFRINTFPNRHGKTAINIRTDRGYHTTLLVGRLVGRAFCPDFHESKVLRHRDGNSLNCHADNLFWISRSAAVVPSPGAHRKTAKLTDELVAKIRAAEGLHREIAERFGIHRSHVSAVRSGRNWNHTYQKA